MMETAVMQQNRAPLQAEYFHTLTTGFGAVQMKITRPAFQQQESGFADLLVFY